MNSVLSLILVICVEAAALPETALEQTQGSFDIHGPASQAMSGPLTRSAMREAGRLAAVEEPTDSGKVVPESGQPAESNWSRVRNVASGTEIIVTAKGSPPGRRYFVAADESDVTMLNVTDARLPAAAAGVLRDLAASHSEYFRAAEKGGQFVLDKSLRLGPNGLSMGASKVTDLSQVIEHIARPDVTEIVDPSRARAAKGDQVLAIPIFFGGGMAGALLGGLLDGGPCSGSVSHCASDAAPRGLFIGFLVGGAAVVLARNAIFEHKSDGVVYRAP
jgi:hypothetical protein